MENKQKIEKFINDSLNSGEVITFFNWECPPRFLDNGQINYLIDLNQIFRGQKIDKFTEIPRVIAQRDKEIRILKFLNKLGIKYRFVKIIADTNAIYLAPESITRYGRNKITRSFRRFREKIKISLKKYPVRTEVYFFTDLINKYTRLYNRSFNKAYSLLEGGQGLVSNQILRQQLKRTREHVGIQDSTYANEFSIRTIATYAAEGMVFNKLSQTKQFSNCIWLNIEEVDNRTITITNSLRTKEGIQPLPMIFLT